MNFLFAIICFNFLVFIMANNDGVIDNNPINNLPKEPEQSKLSDAQVAMNSAVETAELAQRGLLQAEAARMTALQEVQRLAAVNEGTFCLQVFLW